MFEKTQAAQLILSRVCEAYGRMLLLQGLFQADCHPGNILVMKGDHVAVPVTVIRLCQPGNIVVMRGDHVSVAVTDAHERDEPSQLF